jgi:glycosyltransferase involved in cell wall biosynthesis
MASGAVPIAFGVGGVRDVIADPSLGWLIPPRDREAMFQAMQAAVDQPVEARIAMARRCRDHVVTHYRAAEQYRKVVELIEGD